jgi:hypothetical protein
MLIYSYFGNKLTIFTSYDMLHRVVQKKKNGHGLLLYKLTLWPKGIVDMFGLGSRGGYL